MGRPRLNITIEERKQRAKDSAARYRRNYREILQARRRDPVKRAREKERARARIAKLDATIGAKARRALHAAAQALYYRKKMAEVRADPKANRAYLDKRGRFNNRWLEKVKAANPERWKWLTRAFDYMNSLRGIDPERYATWRRKVDGHAAARRERYRVMKADPVRYKQHREKTRAYHQHRVAIRKLQNPRNAMSMHARIKATIQNAVAPELREDLVQELFAAILMREITVEQIGDRAALKPYIARVRKLMPDHRRQFSLDAEVSGMAGLTYIDMLEAGTPHF